MGSFSYHSYNGYEDDQRKPSVDAVSVGGNVWMASLIKLHYTKTRDDVHKRRVYKETKRSRVHCLRKKHNDGNDRREITLSVMVCTTLWALIFILKQGHQCS